MTVRSALSVGVVCVALIPSNLLAQSPTDGLRLPETSITVRDDALALEINPAGLAFIDGFDGNLVFTSTNNDGFSGGGLLLGWGFLDRLGVGTGLQYVEEPAFGGDFKKFTLGFAGRPYDRLSVGLAFNFFDSDADLEVDNFTSWNLGIQARAAEFLGLALAIRDFNTPRLGDVVIEPRYVLGSALRFVEGRYRIELDAIYDAGPDDWLLAFRGVAEPLDGLTFFLESLTTPVDDFGISTLRVGLSFALGSASLTTAATIDFEGDTELAGFSTVIRAVSRPLRTVLEPEGLLAGITLSGSLPERGFSSLILPDQRSFLDLLVYLDRLADDEHIDGLVLRIESVSLGLGQHWELRRALERFRERDKMLVVYLATADFGDLYLASVADHVYLAPATPLFPTGLTTTLTYLGDLFGNIGVEPEFVRIAEYKASAEALMESSPSEPTIEAATAYLDDVYEHMLAAIADGLGISLADAQDVVDTSPIAPAEAASRDLVDGVLFYDELEQTLSEQYSRRLPIVNGYDPAGWRDYRWVEPPPIAIVYIDGNIVEGGSGNMPIVGQTTGHRTLVRLLENLQRSEARAVVLRVDSPGGSAFASEAIWRAIDRLDERIPVVVSMGDVAASGGYYVAAGGREIVATDLTLTGSIGIFSGHFSARDLLQWAGINRFPIARGVNANLFGFDEPWSDSQRDAVTRDIQILYDVFLERVAASRQREPSEIDPVARGRIWSGSRALEVGLVDHIGGLMDAVDRAKELAGLDPDDAVRLVALPERSGLLNLIPMLVSGGQAEMSESEAIGLTQFLQSLGIDRILRIPILYGQGRPAARLEFELEGLE